VNDFLCTLVDDEYEIYLEVERELIETAIESFLKAGEEERRKYPNLSRLMLFPIISFLFGRRPAPKGRWPPL
jgi:hypothetical protein